MIITIIAAVVFLIGIGLLTMAMNCIGDDGMFCWGLGLTVTGAIVTLVTLILILASHAQVDKRIYEAQIDRNKIEMQIEALNSDYEDVSRVTVIENVAEWNKGVHHAKYIVDNPFTSWFESREFADTLEYIDFKE